jgi:hypothetical protein
MSQPAGTSDASNADGTRVEANDGANILGQPDFTGQPNEHISPQQRAGEIAYYLQQAQAECRADIARVEDDRAQELFGRVAGMLDSAIQSLYDFQGGGPGAPLMTH